MRNVRKWTVEEENFLRENRGLGFTKLAESLNRTESSIRKKVEAMGIRTGKRNEWSEEEVAALKENYLKGIYELERLLPTHTKKSIIDKMHNLRLLRSRYDEKGTEQSYPGIEAEIGLYISEQASRNEETGG